MKSLNAKKTNVTRKKLAEAVSNQVGLPLRTSAEIIDVFFETLVNTLAGGESVKLVQFGKFDILDKRPRKGRNPQTGESLIITGRKMVTFRPSDRLRERVNG